MKKERGKGRRFVASLIFKFGKHLIIKNCIYGRCFYVKLSCFGFSLNICKLTYKYVINIRDTTTISTK